MNYRFGRYELDLAKFELRCEGQRQAVEAQVFDLLSLLLMNRHRVVTGSEIHDTIWAGKVVGDAALSSRVKSLRQAIGDDGRRQAWIRTVRKKGFRFVGEVRENADSGPTQTAPAPPNPPSAPSASTSPEFSRLDVGRACIAVLPIVPLGGTDQRQLFADGLVHDIITRIGRTRWLTVTDRGTAFRFRDQAHGQQQGRLQPGFQQSVFEPRAIAKRLGANYVLHGSVQFFDVRLRLTVVLVDVHTGFEIWADNFDRELGDVFTLQEEIADTVVGTLRCQIERREQQRALDQQSENLSAWEAYHRGCWHVFKFAPQHLDDAEHFFNHSVKLDPYLPRAYAGLSFVHWQRAFLELTPDRDAEITCALRYGQQSLEVDPRDSAGRWAVGRALQLFNELDQSVTELHKAVELNPSSVMSLYSLGRSYHLLGQPAASMRLLQRAKRVGPFDPMVFAVSSVEGMNLLSTGRADEAVKLADLSSRQANAHHHILAASAVTHSLANRNASAIDYLDRVLAHDSSYDCDSYFRAFPYQRAQDVAAVRQAFEKLESSLHRRRCIE